MWWKGNSSHILPRSAASIFTFTLTGSMFYNRKNNLFWKSKSLSVFSFDYIYYACWNASEGFTQFLFSLSRSMHTKHLDLKKSYCYAFCRGGRFYSEKFRQCLFIHGIDLDVKHLVIWPTFTIAYYNFPFNTLNRYALNQWKIFSVEL